VELGRAADLFGGGGSVLIQAIEAFRAVDPARVLADIVQDRDQAGVPSRFLPRLVQAALSEQRSALLQALRRHLDRQPTQTLIAALTEAVEHFHPCDPEDEDPTLARLIATYVARSGSALRDQHSAILDGMSRILAPSRDLSPDLGGSIDRLDHELEVWSRIARPISRHRLNQYGRFIDAENIVFELRRAVRELARDGHPEAARHILRAAQARMDLGEGARRELAREIAALDLAISAREEAGAPEPADRQTYAAHVGWRGRRLWIDEEAAGLGASRFDLRSVAFVRWGPSGHGPDDAPVAPYTIAFGDGGGTAQAVTWSRRIYDGFTRRMWRQVGPRLSLEMVDRIQRNERVQVGSLIMDGDGVILRRPSLIGPGAPRRVAWKQAGCVMRQGRLILLARGDPAIHASVCLRDVPNALVLDQILRARESVGGAMAG
jgi:hypothetical protein